MQELSEVFYDLAKSRSEAMARGDRFYSPEKSNTACIDHYPIFTVHDSESCVWCRFSDEKRKAVYREADAHRISRWHEEQNK